MVAVISLDLEVIGSDWMEGVPFGAILRRVECGCLVRRGLGPCTIDNGENWTYDGKLSICYRTELLSGPCPEGWHHQWIESWHKFEYDPFVQALQESFQ